MAKNLVIVESPAKAKTIGKFLGRNYKVTASVGHVRDLPKSTMGVDIENDFEPKYITIRGKGDVIKELRKEAKKADNVILATDPDREGEAIAWHLKTLLEGSVDKFERVTFNAITKDTVKNAVKNARDIDMDLVDAQQARRILDRIVGYSISPLLWAKVRRGLSAGRVQSVATRMICDREDEISNFVPEEYWSIDVETLKNKKKIKFAFVSSCDGKTKLVSKEDVDLILSSMDENLIIKDINKSNRTKSAFNSFTTSTLQQEAYNKLGFSAKKTMSVAQKLYEGIKIGSSSIGLITYMRTDSVRIAPEASLKLKSYIEDTYGKKYIGNTVHSGSKNTQDAHEAIRPSYVDYTPESIAKYLDKDQLKLYTLIWKRFVASHMAKAKFSQDTVTASSKDNIFKVSGSVMTFDGFTKVYDYVSSKDVVLPNFEVGEILKINKILPEQHFTKPKARYTEASLVKAMEELGIGRPSTYAPTISTIISRGYVAKEKKNLLPTELGFIINTIMKDHFKDIVNVKFTAGLEESLDSVEAGKIEWKKVINDFYKEFEPSLELAGKELEKVNMDIETDEICELCGAVILIKHGRFGKFMACSNYPECKNTMPILDKIGISCPICKTGDVIKRKTKKFKDFYGCSTFPNCNFTSWHKPTGDFCNICGKTMIDYKTKSVHKVRCIDNECKSNKLKTTKKKTKTKK
ncbi:MAG: DNA topoisomerase I [Clostridiales bacterium]|nr:MAG: DNA topoisomerase I [Clostridiales bacterium]